jgi:hypothetical protein
MFSERAGNSGTEAAITLSRMTLKKSKRKFNNTVQVKLLMIMYRIVNNIKLVYLPGIVCTLSDCTMQNELMFAKHESRSG